MNDVIYTSGMYLKQKRGNRGSDGVSPAGLVRRTMEEYVPTAPTRANTGFPLPLLPVFLGKLADTDDADSLSSKFIGQMIILLAEKMVCLALFLLNFRVDRSVCWFHRTS